MNFFAQTIVKTMFHEPVPIILHTLLCRRCNEGRKQKGVRVCPLSTKTAIFFSRDERCVCRPLVNLSVGNQLFSRLWMTCLVHGLKVKSVEDLYICMESCA